MATISDVSIIDSNTAEPKRVESGLERTICSPSVCGSKNLTVYRRTILKGRQLTVDAGGAITCPLTFLQCAEHFDPSSTTRPELPAQLSEWGGSGDRLHAEQHFEYRRRLRAHEVLTVRRRAGSGRACSTPWRKPRRRTTARARSRTGRRCPRLPASD